MSISIITPAHDGSVTSQGKTVVPPRGYSDHVDQAHGSIRLTVPVVAPSRDRTVVGWGNDDDRVSPPAGLTDVVAIAAGDARSLALATVRPKLAALRFLSGGELEFTLHGEDGVRHAIESSTNLSVWQPLMNAMCVNGVATVRDSAGSAQRFYRAVLVAVSPVEGRAWAVRLPEEA
jgi:hypothetical protein